MSVFRVCLFVLFAVSHFEKTVPNVAVTFSAFFNETVSRLPIVKT